MKWKTHVGIRRGATGWIDRIRHSLAGLQCLTIPLDTKRHQRAVRRNGGTYIGGETFRPCDLTWWVLRLAGLHFHDDTCPQ